MSMYDWIKKGSTISDKSARDLYGLTQKELLEAMKSGRLQYRENQASDRHVFRFLKSEIELLVEEKSASRQIEKPPRDLAPPPESPREKPAGTKMEETAPPEKKHAKKNGFVEELVRINSKIQKLKSLVIALEKKRYRIKKEMEKL